MTSNTRTGAYRPEALTHWNATTLGASLEGVVSKVLAILITWQARSEEREVLAGLDDRMLADIGMTRAEARRESSKPFWRA